MTDPWTFLAWSFAWFLSLAMGMLLAALLWGILFFRRIGQDLHRDFMRMDGNGERRIGVEFGRHPVQTSRNITGRRPDET